MWFTLREALVYLLASTSLVERFPSIKSLGILQTTPQSTAHAVQQHVPQHIPQFILDSWDSWINNNRDVLDKMDAKEALCNVDSPLRSFLPDIPHDLFHYIEISNDYQWRNRLGWDNALARLSEIRDCPAALNSCHTITIEIYHVLQSMTNLSTVEWIRPCHQNPAVATFMEAFAEQEMTLPKVTTMKVAPGTQSLVQHAPNLEIIGEAEEYVWISRPEPPGKPNYHLELINGAAKAKNLKEFTLGFAWDEEHLEALVTAMPQLETLHLEGSIKLADPVQYGRFNAGGGLKTLAAILAKLPKLTELHLPCASGLSIGFDIGIGSWHYYDGLDAAKRQRELERESMWGTTTAGKIIADGLPNLQRLSIGSIDVDPRSADEDGRLAWPWRGRVKEYLLETTDWYIKHLERTEGFEWKEDSDEPVLWSSEMDEIMLDEDWVPWALGYEAMDENRQSRQHGDDYREYWAL
ncbi:hypothetical protein PT974_07228 [Cladobotryum mycophilum]|uniref:Uncharacterized protein n=1 Tax=Cladobotryum mycophilum TaxID=491253 RepID=A0ABR0SNN2_9HYPO